MQKENLLHLNLTYIIVGIFLNWFVRAPTATSSACTTSLNRVYTLEYTCFGCMVLYFPPSVSSGSSKPSTSLFSTWRTPFCAFVYATSKAMFIRPNFISLSFVATSRDTYDIYQTKNLIIFSSKSISPAYMFENLHQNKCLLYTIYRSLCMRLHLLINSFLQ